MGLRVVAQIFVNGVTRVPRPRRDARPGYVLPWVIVTVALIAVIAAAAAPALVTINDTDRANATAATLRAISNAVNTFDVTVKSGGGPKNNFPGQVSELAAPVTTANHTSCWTTLMNANDSTSWLTAGPFSTFYVPADGLWTPIGRIRDSIPNRSTNLNDSIWIEIPGVSGGDAAILDQIVDGAVNGALDTVRYHPPVNDTTTIRFRVTPRLLGKC